MIEELPEQQTYQDFTPASFYMQDSRRHKRSEPRNKYSKNKWITHKTKSFLTRLTLYIVGGIILIFLIHKLFLIITLDQQSEMGQEIVIDRVGNITIPVASQEHKPLYYHRHNGKIFNFSTVGIPEPGKDYNSTQVNKKNYRQFDQQVNQLFKPYNDTDCYFSRYGGSGGSYDGGYVICNNFMQNAQALINIGIDGYDNFGCQVTTLRNIPNLQFDCTKNERPICDSNNKHNTFHDACLGAKTQRAGRYTYFTLQDMINIHNLTTKHTIVKIDCQGCQYSGLKYFPVYKLDYIDTLVIQFHFDSIYSEEWGMLDIFKTLMTKFVSVNYHMNNHGCMSGRQLRSRAVQVTLVNRKLIKLKSNSRAYKSNGWNQPNAKYSDCQLYA